jgi:hypothetical protein
MIYLRAARQRARNTGDRANLRMMRKLHRARRQSRRWTMIDLRAARQ